MFDAAATIENTARFVRGEMQEEGSHDWWHIRRVWQLAWRIGKAEGADTFVVEMAALLHDLDDWKLAAASGRAPSDGIPRRAIAWVQSCAVPQSDLDHIAGIIQSLSFKGANVETPMATLEGKVVQDADRLDAIGAVGIARAFAYGGHKGQPLWDPEVPPTLHDSFESYQRGAGSTINHFYEKLLLLAGRMNTKTGRDLARGRHAVMEQFLKDFFAEWNAP
ncbi:MAG: HD domain-containing protein [Planctomycetia bacterium]|nr:HD domain-containing protein [Planctomycetia bacterium]